MWSVRDHSEILSETPTASTLHRQCSSLTTRLLPTKVVAFGELHRGVALCCLPQISKCVLLFSYSLIQQHFKYSDSEQFNDTG